MSDTVRPGAYTLGYAPLLDAQLQPQGLRLTAAPLPGASVKLDAWWQALDGLDSTGGDGRPRLCVNLADEALLLELLQRAPGPRRMVEVPAFLAARPEHLGALNKARASATPLVLTGRAPSPLPAEVLRCFSHCVLEEGEDRRESAAGTAEGRHIATLRSGVRTRSAAEAAFQQGAGAVIGWPLADQWPTEPSRQALPTELTVAMDLVSALDRGEEVAALESMLRRAPALSFKLMRYLNSPGFGLRTEVTSLGHAVMLLGYQRLRRWVALLLVSAAQGPVCAVTAFAALRRALVMESLLGPDMADADTRSELFLCGLFSLLPVLLQQPMDTLLESLPVPERVRQGLLGAGPHAPYLALVKAIEGNRVIEQRELCETLVLEPAAVARAVVVALVQAEALSA